MIPVQKVSNGHLIFFPMCPSTNDRMMPVRMGRHLSMILTKDAREYIEDISIELRLLKDFHGIKTINRFAYFDMWYILSRTNQDSHNYNKILFDAIEQGGIVENDKFIMPRTMGISYNSKEPEIIILIPSI